ncbi:MAG: hypothetical protein MJY57_01640 [Bacteroidales bacterium]|nr:hypothetical protein [Bacteroidales bacterium]
MAAHYKSKHGTVTAAPEALYMNFVDMRNFTKAVPANLGGEVKADFDTLNASVQGFNIGVKVEERIPYQSVRFASTDSPFQFNAVLHFDHADIPGRTDFHVEVDADLNFMMKTLLGSKIQDALDKAVDALVDASNGQRPEGVPEDLFKNV